ncbi:hypothetical protein ScPMuIL_017000 [Solemya velum]
MSDIVAVVVCYTGGNIADTHPFAIDDDIFQLPIETKWMDFEAMMKAKLDSDDVQVRYIDIDDDPITISSQEELTEAFRTASQTSDVLRLRVRDIGNTSVAKDKDAVFSEPIPLPPPPTKSEVKDSQDTQPVEQVVTISSPESKVSESEVEPEELQVVDVVEQLVDVDAKPFSKEVNTEETGENPPKDLQQDAETGTFSKVSHASRKRSKRMDPYTRAAMERGEAKRLSKSADRAVFSRKTTSGEVTEKENTVPYLKFVEFLEQLKHDLRSEIVRDVTRKTVKQVLKGLDGAVIQSVQGTSGIPLPLAVKPPTTAEPVPNTSLHPVYYHNGVICDHCQCNIVGTRYKCGNCPDFDLCEECENIYGAHDPDHVFLKLRRPTRALKMTDGSPAPLLAGVLYRLEETEEELNQNAKKSLERLQEKMARKQEKLKKKEEKLVEKQRKKEEKLKRRLETIRDLPHKREKLDLPLPQRTIPTSILMKAEFLYDVTIPDHTIVQPGTKMQKIWRMKNVGSATWSDITQLRLMWGNIPATKTEVPVPHLRPDEEGDVVAELVAPLEPGKYHSHWKMFDAGMQFGHRVWCAIIVVPREVLEPIMDERLKVVPVLDERLKVVPEEPELQKSLKSEADEETEENNVIVERREPLVVVNEEEERSDSSEQESVVSRVELDLTTAAAAVAQLKLEQKPVVEVTGGEMTSFEVLDLRERIPPKVSQTATPTNTPHDVTPPKSPTPEPSEHLQSPLSNSSSVEVVSGEQDDDLAQMTEFVQERMAGLGLKPEIDIDLESLSSFSDDDDSSLSDSDFFIVPLPDCFDPSKPMIQSVVDFSDEEETDSNHNTIVSSGPADNLLGDILSTSSSSSVPSMNPIVLSDVGATGPQAAEVLIKQDHVDSSMASLPAEPLDKVVTTGEASDRPDTSGDDRVLEDVGAGCKASENSATQSSVNSEQSGGTSVSLPKIDVGFTTEPSGASAEQQGETTSSHLRSEEASEGPLEADNSDSTQQNPSEFANQIMVTAVSAAARAATHAYATAKGVFYTLQAKHTAPQGQYKPPQSTWKPSEKQWKPSEKKWTPPKSDWKPATTESKPQVPQSDPEPEPAPAKETETGPMRHLIEMGFCDRKLNTQLLEKHKNDLDLVIQALLQLNDSNWAESRH